MRANSTSEEQWDSRSRAVLSRMQNARHEWQGPTTNVVGPCTRLCTQRLIVTGHVHRDHSAVGTIRSCARIGLAKS